MIVPAAVLAVAVPAVAIQQNLNWAEIFTAFAAAVTPLVVLVVRWLDKRDERNRQDKKDEWERQDLIHKQKLDAALAEAKLEAARAARLVEESKKERKEQMEVITKKIDENTQISVTAFDAANGVNAKIASIGLDLAAAAKDRVSETAIALQEHANAKLDEIAENTAQAPTQKLT